MRAPHTPKEDFVQPIVDGLRPWKSPRDHVLAQVRNKLDVVQRVITNPPASGFSNVNRQHAEKILEVGTKLKSLLESAPSETLRFLFYPLKASPNDFLEMFEREEEEGRSEAFALARGLGRLCTACEGVIRFRPGEDPRFGWKQHIAVLGAYELVIELSTKKPTRGPLLDISGLLYEAVTEKRPPENGLLVACRAVLGHFRAERIHTQKT
jgi:hypothetical protein